MATLFDDIMLGQIDLQNVKTLKSFLAHTSHTLTEEECEIWISRFSKPTGIRVINKWSYLMGRIGSTSLTLENKNGRKMEFQSHPSWRPLAVCNYSFSYYDYVTRQTKYKSNRMIAQSWQEIKEMSSDTDNMTWFVYKHPHQ